MLKTCVIGMGPIGTTHAGVYATCEGVSLVAVCDRDEERARLAGMRFSVPWYLHAQEMLERHTPDVCSVATGGFEYASDHCEPTLQALRAGAHVLCEKPISNDLKQAAEMVETARLLDRCLAIDLNHRFTPAARTAKRWQDEGLLGDLLFVNMALWIGKFGPLDSEYYHLKALNPHSVDLMRYFCGDVESVHCFAMKAPGRTLWSTASINMQFRNGMVGHLTSSYDIERGHPMERCEVAGTKGRLVINDMWREATLYPAGNLERRVYANPVFGGFRDFEDTFRDRITSFVREVARGVRPAQIDGSGAQGLAASRVIHAAIQSLKSGQPVRVDDVSE
jgi:predicted dehydrogenase